MPYLRNEALRAAQYAPAVLPSSARRALDWLRPLREGGALPSLCEREVHFYGFLAGLRVTVQPPRHEHAAAGRPARPCAGEPADLLDAHAQPFARNASHVRIAPRFERRRQAEGAQAGIA